MLSFGGWSGLARVLLIGVTACSYVVLETGGTLLAVKSSRRASMSAVSKLSLAGG